MTDDPTRPPAERPVEDRWFVYWNGTEKVFGDPLAIGRKLERVCPDYLDLIGVVAREVPKQFAGAMGGSGVGEDLLAQRREADEKLLAATRQAFDVKPGVKDGKPTGLTEDECAYLLLAYLLWCGLAATDPEVAVFSDSRPRDAPSIPPG